jgi:hypothetical protein
LNFQGSTHHIGVGSFSKLKEITQKIEDYIMNCGNRNLEPEEQAGVFLEIHKMISELYSVIDEAHMGNT